MSEDQWSAVDRYFAEQLLPDDPALEAALEASAAAGLPAINVSPNQGMLLQLLARAIGARRILEIGTLGGYSTIWLARALPADGRLITLEADARHADVARANLARAGLADVVEVRLGRALDTLPRWRAKGRDRSTSSSSMPTNRTTRAYFEWALRLTRPGSLIVVDNVVRGGDVVDAASDDAGVQGVRRFWSASPASRGCGQPRSRPLAARATTGLPSRW